MTTDIFQHLWGRLFINRVFLSQVIEYKLFFFQKFPEIPSPQFHPDVFLVWSHYVQSEMFSHQLWSFILSNQNCQLVCMDFTTITVEQYSLESNSETPALYSPFLVFFIEDKGKADCWRGNNKWYRLRNVVYSTDTVLSKAFSSFSIKH